MRGVITAILLVALAGSAIAAPDEEALGKAQGYPVGTALTWWALESVRVGSFTAQGEIPGIANGGVNSLAPSDRPMPLPKAESEPDFRWEVSGQRNLSIDDYLSRQRVMGLMIVKDGVIQVERYQYDRRADHRFLSNSMAKSVLALAIGIALEEGKIRSLDDRADVYVPALTGTLYGATTIRNLLRMASGARYVEVYDGKDDAARFSRAVTRDGIEAAAQAITEREAPQGAKFNYASAQSAMLGAVLRRATGESLAEYLTPRLWR
ncbi:MAG: serine hydrolase domain-containing protein, partial [Elsteraceae bacterium]